MSRPPANATSKFSVPNDRMAHALGRLRRAFASLLVWTLGVLSMSCAQPGTGLNESDLEQPICGPQEPVLSWIWSKAAGSPSPARLDHLANVEEMSLTTRDGRVLRGYKLTAAHEGHDSARGFLLVTQGNAMLADRVVGSFTDFSRAGYDVYVFDYRGYGRSDGLPRLKAIVSDYREVVQYLQSFGYASQRYYGMSFGGIVLLATLEAAPAHTRVVIDSTPSRLTKYGCPPPYDPVAKLPEDASNYLFIAGSMDPIVEVEESKELLDVAESRGATVLRDPGLSHPFMHEGRAARERRMSAVREFLLIETPR